MAPTDVWPRFFLEISTHPGASFSPPQLKWLGLPDFRASGSDAPHLLFKHFLPLCTRIETLSIRGEYRAESTPSHLNAHEYVCNFVDGIVTCTPYSVTALELRLSIPCLDKLTEVIRATSGLNINRIGIDLGAWIQVYPIKDTAEELSEGRIWAEAIHAARRTRRDIYEEEHNKVLPAKSKSLLPDSRADVDLTAPPSLPASTDALAEVDFHEARPGFKYDFFQDDGGGNTTM
jgi:hypothetical protein